MTGETTPGGLIPSGYPAFLTLGDEAHERDLERGLLAHLRGFLLEMGQGFAFVCPGGHYFVWAASTTWRYALWALLRIGESDFYIDLLFYHTRLHCYVVVDLKMGKFTPADAGQLNFYLPAVDDLLRTEGDGPTLGLLLCRTRDETVAEYALHDIRKPMGVAEFRLGEALPEGLKGTLPTIEELEAELGTAEMDEAEPADAAQPGEASEVAPDTQQAL